MLFVATVKRKLTLSTGWLLCNVFFDTHQRPPRDMSGLGWEATGLPLWCDEELPVFLRKYGFLLYFCISPHCTCHLLLIGAPYINLCLYWCSTSRCCCIQCTCCFTQFECKTWRGVFGWRELRLSKGYARQCHNHPNKVFCCYCYVTKYVGRGSQ